MVWLLVLSCMTAIAYGATGYLFLEKEKIEMEKAMETRIGIRTRHARAT